MKNPGVHPALRERGMRLIGWSARGFDTRPAPIDDIAARVMRDIRPGAIVLVHQGLPWSLQVIERVVSEVRARGYELVVPDDARLR